MKVDSEDARRRGRRSPPSLPGNPAARSASPLLKWPGGKEGELRHILGAMPPRADRVFEPFVGGGAVFLSRLDLGAAINDRSFDLVNFYRSVAAQSAGFFSRLEAMDSAWRGIEGVSSADRGAILEARGGGERSSGLASGLVARHPQAWEACASAIGDDPGLLDRLHTGVRRGVVDKLGRMNRLEAQRGRLAEDDVVANVEGAMKGAMYLAVRWAYNRRAGGPAAPCPERAALFFFLREYCYASMFRFNRSGGFNVPYGGMSYNRKRMAGKLAAMREPSLAAALGRATICHLDFEEFLRQHPPGTEDFVFFDPPYDSDFSTYDQSAFDEGDQRRLRAAVGRLGDGCPWMLVVKATPLMAELYDEREFRVRCFDKTYLWTIKERNHRQAQHMMVTNY